ncbi:cobW-domain-containing protein [Vararia minispora EC-137]|uniref:CobW-domain-containing protein n=1 Tax=Vararia minispora EC-137 TaxID=1314806 RepID=A0ACB8QKL9_9AGAM|nr:cobW-domain-containing protein [Vararia minispora EC-137]
MQDDEIPTLIDVDNLETLPPGQPDPGAKPVPLTIITGFLGAGKSTLLKRILTERHGYRIAVIMNEFGDSTDIESKTIGVESGDVRSEEFLELPNGCLCCSIKDTGVAAIEELMKRKGAFDYILLETTGLADPGPIASIFWQNEEYGKGLGWDIILDGVVCLVDAVNGLHQMMADSASNADSVGESLRQLAAADIVLLNKIDAAPLKLVEETEAMIHRVNPALAVHRTMRAEIDLAKVIGIGAYASGPPPITVHVHDEHCAHSEVGEVGSTHYAVRGISSLQVRCPPLSSAKLDALDIWIRTLLWDARLPLPYDAGEGLEILRCKGLLETVDGRRLVLQGVRSMYELEEVPRKGGEGRVGDEGKLVFIGKGLGEAVRESLEAVLR